MISRRIRLALLSGFSLCLVLFLSPSLLRAAPGEDSPFFNLRNRPAGSTAAETTPAETAPVELAPDTVAGGTEPDEIEPDTDLVPETSPLDADTETSAATASAVSGTTPLVPEGDESETSGISSDPGRDTGSAVEAEPPGVVPDTSVSVPETEPEAPTDSETTVTAKPVTPSAPDTTPSDREVTTDKPAAETEPDVSETETSPREPTTPTVQSGQPDEPSQPSETAVDEPEAATDEQARDTVPRAVPQPSKIPGPPFPEPMVAGLVASESLPVETKNLADSWTPDSWPVPATGAGAAPLSTVQDQPGATPYYSWSWHWLDWGAVGLLVVGLTGLLVIYLRLRSSGPRVFYSTSGGRTSSSRPNSTSSVSGPADLTASTVPSRNQQRDTTTTPSSASETSEDQMPIWRYPDEKLKKVGIDPKYRQVFKLHYGRQKSIEEIAEETDFGTGEIGLVLNLSELITDN